jgi:hypothetical protein
MRKFVVDIHPHGYAVREIGKLPLSTHADIIEAITACRAANRFARDMLYGLIERTPTIPGVLTVEQLDNLLGSDPA